MENLGGKLGDKNRVSTKWINQLRKTGNIFGESCAWNEILVLCNFFRNLRKTASFTQNVTF